MNRYELACLVSLLFIGTCVLILPGCADPAPKWKAYQLEETR